MKRTFYRACWRKDGQRSWTYAEVRGSERAARDDMWALADEAPGNGEVLSAEAASAPAALKRLVYERSGGGAGAGRSAHAWSYAWEIAEKLRAFSQALDGDDRLRLREAQEAAVLAMDPLRWATFGSERMALALACDASAAAIRASTRTEDTADMLDALARSFTSWGEANRVEWIEFQRRRASPSSAMGAHPWISVSVEEIVDAVRAVSFALRKGNKRRVREAVAAAVLAVDPLRRVTPDPERSALCLACDAATVAIRASVRSPDAAGALHDLARGFVRWEAHRAYTVDYLQVAVSGAPVVDDDLPAALAEAPLDDEPVTQEEEDAVVEARADVAHGRTFSTAELLYSLGLPWVLALTDAARALQEPWPSTAERLRVLAEEDPTPDEARGALDALADEQRRYVAERIGRAVGESDSDAIWRTAFRVADVQEMHALVVRRATHLEGPRVNDRRGEAPEDAVVDLARGDAEVLRRLERAACAYLNGTSSDPAAPDFERPVLVGYLALVARCPLPACAAEVREWFEHHAHDDGGLDYGLGHDALGALATTLAPSLDALSFWRRWWRDGPTGWQPMAFCGLRLCDAKAAAGELPLLVERADASGYGPRPLLLGMWNQEGGGGREAVVAWLRDADDADDVGVARVADRVRRELVDLDVWPRPRRGARGVDPQDPNGDEGGP